MQLNAIYCQNKVMTSFSIIRCKFVYWGMYLCWKVHIGYNILILFLYYLIVMWNIQYFDQHNFEFVDSRQEATSANVASSGDKISAQAGPPNVKLVADSKEADPELDEDVPF